MKKHSTKKSSKKCKKEIQRTLDFIIRNRGKVSLFVGIIGCIISFYYGKNTATKKDIEKVEQTIQIDGEKTREELHSFREDLYSFMDGFAENISSDELLKTKTIKADSLYHMGRFKEAYNLYDEINEKALSSGKENLFVLSLMGKSISIGMQGYYQEAIEMLKNSENYIDFLDNNAKGKLYFNLGLCNVMLKNNDLAIEYYSKSLNKCPNNANVYTNRGAAYGDKGEYERAIQDFNKAIKLDPKNAVAYYNRGFSYQNKGEYDKAIQDFNKAIALNTKYAEAYNNRGISYYNKGEYDKAIQDYNKVIELNPKYAAAYNNRGGSYYNKGE